MCAIVCVFDTLPIKSIWGSLTYKNFQWKSHSYMYKEVFPKI